MTFDDLEIIGGAAPVNINSILEFKDVVTPLTVGKTYQAYNKGFNVFTIFQQPTSAAVARDRGKPIQPGESEFFSVEANQDTFVYCDRNTEITVAQVN